MSPSFSPTDLHAENVGRLRPEDVVIASYPGSGAALIGNVLLSLGLAYVDPYTEVVDDHGGGPVPERVDYRARLAATHAADTSEDRSAVAARRLVKTHRHPDEFPARPEQIVALVRDPRDAVHSYYRWRLGFSEESESGSNVGTSTENGRLMPGRRSVNGGGALAAKRVRPTGTSRSASSASSLIL